MIVGDRSRSLGSLVNCSAIVTIIWKPNLHFASDRQRSQRLPTIATITIAGIESESISAIVAIANDRQRSQKVRATFHLTISMRDQRATGKIQRNNYGYGSCGPSLTGKTSSVSLIFTHGTHRNVKNH